MKNKFEKQEWLLEYLKEHRIAHILDMEFVDQYIEKFNPKHIVMPWGANKCDDLGKMLSWLYNQGILEREIRGVKGGKEFPKWVYIYELSELGKRMSN